VVKTSPAKPVDSGDWSGRLRNARDFKRDAEELIALRDDDDNANGVITLIVNAAIAYADALTGKYGGFVNQQDHRAVGTGLTRALGQRADKTQLKRLGTILGQKDASSYGPRRTPKQKAQDLLEQLDRFASWVEEEMARQ
jgi:hypothetical protein